MAKHGDMEKLNAALGILDSTDLGLSLVWLYTWNMIKEAMEDEEYKFNLTEEQVWNELVKAVDEGHEFNLRYGAEQLYQDVNDWLIGNNIMTDMMFAMSTEA